MNAGQLDDMIRAVGPDFHGLSYRERLIVGAVLKFLSTLPADDVREALAQMIQNAEDGDLTANGWSRSPGPGQRRAADALVAAFDVRPRGTVTDASVEQLREARAETWDEAVAAVFAWWEAPDDQHPLAIVNPYGVGLGGDESDAREVHP